MTFFNTSTKVIFDTKDYLKIQHKKITMDSDSSVPKKRSNLFIILGISYLLIMAFLIVIPTKTISENVKVPYLDNETYYVQEPYDVEEPYVIQEPYEVQEPYQTEGLYTDTVTSYPRINAPSGSHFETDAYDTTKDGCDCSGWMNDQNHNPRQVCIQKKCEKIEKVTKYGTLTNYRPVTKYQSVTKYHTVTIYKEVPKVRDVIKTRIEPRPAEVNWVIGFKTPYTLHLPFT